LPVAAQQQQQRLGQVTTQQQQQDQEQGCSAGVCRVLVMQQVMPVLWRLAAAVVVGCSTAVELGMILLSALTGE
jgi:hypothetical protein